MKDQSQQNIHERNGCLKYTLRANSGYEAQAIYPHVSAAQYKVITEILNQRHKRYINNTSGMEVTLLFTALDTATNEQVAVYIGSNWDIATCPFYEWQNEFHVISSSGTACLCSSRKVY